MYIARSKSSEGGFVLVVAMIMLLAVTLLVVTGSNISASNTKIVQNLESREDARVAALSAIEEAISSARFTTSPENIFSVSCQQSNQKCYDVNGDTINDIVVQVAAPSCVAVTPIPNSDLDVYTSPAQASCYLPPAVYSMCANSVWEFVATATDAATGTEVSVRQGVTILTTLNAIESACPT